MWTVCGVNGLLMAGASAQGVVGEAAGQGTGTWHSTQRWSVGRSTKRKSVTRSACLKVRLMSEYH